MNEIEKNKTDDNLKENVEKEILNSNVKKTIYRTKENLCVCCGAVIPEGQMICWSCEHGYSVS